MHVTATPDNQSGMGDMDLGAFSISLNVADLATSMAFYAKFGFTPVMGDEESWVILRNRDHTIGLFQGMFEGNVLTFNPGWNAQGEQVESFTDVRELQRQLTAAGIDLVQRADEATVGPAYLTAVDPDGNTILIDQHV